MKEQLILPANLPPDRGQQRRVLIVALLVLIPFVAIIPFGQMQLPRVDSYIPVVDTVMLINDTIAATLLLAQFSIVRAPSLLALAGGFLGTAFLVIPHALTFPDAFAPNGLLGAGLQTTPWLNEFWFMGLPSAVIAYALLKRVDSASPIPGSAVPLAILATVVAAFVLTCALVWLTTMGIGLLPPIMSDTVHPQLSWHFLPPVILSVTAMLLLWSQRSSMLDLWLLVVLEAWMLNALLFHKLVVRFSLFWYCGRVFAALATSLVLLFLISQTTTLYWRLARANIMLERERHNKLMNAQAITAAIAHQIRQPLAVITANASAALRWLERSPPNRDEIRACLSKIVSEGHRASDVFDSIRALFRADQGWQRINVNDIILGVIDSLRAELQDHGVVTRTALLDDLPLISGHMGQLREVVLNLLNNAVEAMNTTINRTRELSIRTEIHNSEAISVSVQDSGPGIDPKRLQGIFNAFVTTKSHGMGLGLALCHMIIEHHGGKLTASSDGNSGALFQFILPLGSGDKRNQQSDDSNKGDSWREQSLVC